jgi:LacI family transcriptional regulator
LVTVEELERSGVAAIVLMGRAEPELRQDLVQRKIPTVICGNYTFDQPELSAVCSDNYGGMRRMVRHVIEQGHTDIAYYTTDVPTHDGFYRRLLAYREAMQTANLRAREEMVFQENHSPSSARWAADVFVALSRRPTAIVCGSDRDAYELISELHRSNVEVPKDVGVTGFDNSVYYAIAELGLTSVEIYGRETGSLAGQHLLKIMEKPHLPIRIMAPTQLVSRTSLSQIS